MSTIPPTAPPMAGPTTELRRRNECRTIEPRAINSYLLLVLADLELCGIGDDVTVATDLKG
jgi:hypothetical protein